MIKVKALNHVAIRVADAERSKDFYNKVLALPTRERPNFPMGGEWYGLGPNMLHVIESKPGEKKIDPTAPHIALDVEDLEAARQRLKELGIEYLEAANAQAAIGNADRRLTGAQLWFCDPDGNTIELRTP